MLACLNNCPRPWTSPHIGPVNDTSTTLSGKILKEPRIPLLPSLLSVIRIPCPSTNVSSTSYVVGHLCSCRVLTWYQRLGCRRPARLGPTDQSWIKYLAPMPYHHADASSLQRNACKILNEFRHLAKWFTQSILLYCSCTRYLSPVPSPI